MKKYIPFLILLLSYSAVAQIGISATNTPPNASAMLDVSSTTKGILIPRMTTIQKNAITDKVEGLMVYDTDLQQFSYWTGITWANVANAASAGVGWVQTNNNLSNTNGGNVGIGTATPSKKLEINSGKVNTSGVRLSQLVGSPAAGYTSSDFATITNVTGLAFDNAGNLYATNFSGNKIHKITESGIVSDFVITGLSGPHDIVFGSDNNLYVSNYTGNYVSKITLAGTVTTFASGFSNPIGLTFDNAGNLFVVNNSTGQLSKLSPTGSIIAISFGYGLSSPYNCVFSSITNKIYVSNYSANEIAQFDASTGGAKVVFASSINFCTGITIDNTGNLYVSEASPNKVVKITPSATVSDFISTTYPFDLIFDNSENLLVANQTTNKISKNSLIYNTLLSITSNGDIVSVSPKDLDVAHTVGESFGGGIIFYVTPNGKHGLIAATQDQVQVPETINVVNPGANWYSTKNNAVDPTKHNAAGKNYTDWRVPTTSELQLLYINRNVVGGFTTFIYWSSTETASNDGLAVGFGQVLTPGTVGFTSKANGNNLRAIRSF